MTTLFALDTALTAYDVLDLRVQLEGSLFLSSDDGYEEALRGWNKAVTQRPAAIVCARSAQDVVHAVAFAHDTGFPPSVRSGGHNAAGLGYCDGGVMIDLKQMNRITVDVEQRVARAQPGVKLGPFVPQRRTTASLRPPAPLRVLGWVARRSAAVWAGCWAATADDR